MSRAALRAVSGSVPAVLTPVLEGSGAGAARALQPHGSFSKPALFPGKCKADDYLGRGVVLQEVVQCQGAGAGALALQELCGTLSTARKQPCASSAKRSQSSQEHLKRPQLTKPTVYRLHFYVISVPTKCQKQAQGKV